MPVTAPVTAPAIAELIPLITDTDGVIRVADSRVTLDSIVAAFEAGASPEEIAQQFPSLALPDLYAILTYYLRHRPEIEEYLRKRREQAAAVRAQNESRPGARELRERLLARKAR